MSRLPRRVAALLLGLLVEMPPLRGLLWFQVLREGPLHTEAVVFLVPPDDGRALLLRSRLLYPEAHVPPAADRGACVQRVLHQAAPEPRARSPAAGTAILHRPWRTGDESCRKSHGDGFPGPTQLTPGKHSLPSAPLLLQYTPAPI
ncbi:vesicular, overexpressed in cancer, prosurvival protein 1 isoform X2 [Phoca vitulina]|uniref:vesicular, overexpressed in cancer, prosurvival protein 1 isoform X2 n=1 Tax=Phoca vitulina TaxID=9720 RepID=UPI001395E171|nr:vesicular, overexpressed in cancer, prosurvival protein 1 isoform X2 [Phoca vitulina]